MRIITFILYDWIGTQRLIKRNIFNQEMTLPDYTDTMHNFLRYPPKVKREVV